MEAEPTIIELIDAAGRAIAGQGDKNADLVRGSDYESITGPAAVIWTREDRRDEDLFNATKFHTAQGEDLTFLVKKRYGIDRYLDTNGQGTALLSRPTNAAGAGTIWAGTRISIFGGSAKVYRTTADVVVEASSYYANLPIESITPGPGCAAEETENLRLEDVLWDTSWTVSSLNCKDGTTYESAAALVARVRKTRTDLRVGQVKSIKDACKAVGADNVQVFRSNYGGDALDGGLNVVYVGDLGWQGSPSLVKACFLALRSVRVLGDHMQVLPMTRVTLNPVIDVYLATAPALNDIENLYQIHRAAVTEYLGGVSGGFSFTKIGILSSLARPTPEVQRAVVVTPASDVNVLTNGNFPAVLNRYVVGTVTIRYHGP